MPDTRKIPPVFEAMIGFFVEMANMVHSVGFTSGHPIKYCNLPHGCRALKGKGKKRHNAQFAFIEKHGREVLVDIHLPSLAANPEEYVGNMIENIPKLVNEAQKNDRIIVPQFRGIARPGVVH